VGAYHEESLTEEGQREEYLHHPNNGEPHGMRTPRWHLQEEHDATTPLPPDPEILGFHPEHVERPSTAITMPSRR
jgi:hypothetical protein